ncbi:MULTISPECIES: hypothetical protein [unclassified Streptomyces]|uniref:hypothetical protein n=1 Tax=unclassified Streptomyces TaxID=2593676 RepID=UPI0023650225|nr:MULTISPECIES: hypothetical protein [unclassified Streptomyces]MDF3139926.1 hypothetical protein [Streptomyces sp. T21Q-yed]WDF44013.1 hypothetical protein PBV52_48145 [Streptomyces sp. T12]
MALRILQGLIEAEGTDVIGAAPGERSGKRTTWRNRRHCCDRPPRLLLVTVMESNTSLRLCRGAAVR